MQFFFIATENGALITDWDDRKAPPACPVCGRPVGPDPAAGYVVHVDQPAELKDLNHAAPVYVASPAFVEWYGRTGQSGLAFDPLPGIKGRQRARITGSARLAASSRATVRERCDHCGYRYYEVAGPWEIDEGAWDGSSFFAVVERPSAMFCTETAKAAIEDSGLAGPVFMEMELVML
jgi:hypothetical protein